MPKAPDPNDPLKRELDQIRLQLGEVESAEDDPDTILLVDDEDSVREVVASMLLCLGYEVVDTPDGRQAIEYYTEHGDDIDLVILDMTMPVMDGAACFRQLKTLDPAVKIVLATGHAMEEDAHDLMKAGALRFVQKPFAVQQLSDALSAAFGSTRNTHDDC